MIHFIEMLRQPREHALLPALPFPGEQCRDDQSGNERAKHIRHRIMHTAVEMMDRVIIEYDEHEIFIEFPQRGCRQIGECDEQQKDAPGLRIFPL